MYAPESLVKKEDLAFLKSKSSAPQAIICLNMASTISCALVSCRSSIKTGWWRNASTSLSALTSSSKSLKLIFWGNYWSMSTHTAVCPRSKELH